MIKADLLFLFTCATEDKRLEMCLQLTQTRIKVIDFCCPREEIPITKCKVGLFYVAFM